MSPSSISSIIDAEEAVIASCILQPEWLDSIDLDPEDFIHQEWQTIYKALIELYFDGRKINELTVAQYVKDQIDSLSIIPGAISRVPTSLDCPAYAKIVKDASIRRKIEKIGHNIIDRCKSNVSNSDIIDLAHAEFDEVKLPSKLSRHVTLSDAIVLTSKPPTYIITISVRNGGSSKVQVSSRELDSPREMKRKIREQLKINPILPKNYDGLIHNLITRAKDIEAPTDASEEELICHFIREWISSGIEAETIEDLTHGYVVRRGYYLFHSPVIRNMLVSKLKKSVSPSRLFQILINYGCIRMGTRIGSKPVRLWGLPVSFFKEEEAGGEAELFGNDEDEDDLSWLEGEGT